MSQYACDNNYGLWRKGGGRVEANTEEILKKLKNAGLKFTGKRQDTVEWFVRNQDRFVSAKEVYEHVKSIYPNVSYDTIYRTIATLLEHNIIEHMEFSDNAAKYRLVCHDAHHHHMVCIGCGSTFPIDDCPMDQMLSKVNHFRVIAHRFEIYGYCDACLHN